MPEAQSVALASGTPTSGAMGFQIHVPGVMPPDGRPGVEVLGNVTTPGYFATLRIPLIAGRDFDDTDTGAAARIMIVSQAAARRFWPSLAPHEAIGRQVLLQPNLVDRGSPRGVPALVPITIVGIAADVRSGGTPRPYIYLPIQQQYVSAINILVRPPENQRGIARVRELLLAMDRRVPVLSAGALENQAGPVTIQLRVSAAIAGTLGMIGALLATMGVYGVTSYMVARRTREIGIRVALGADRGAVVRMAVGETARLLATGGILGLLLAAMAVRLLWGFQFGVAADPVPFAGTLALFAIVGLVASYVPVRRALAIDPSRALRYE
jgi:putative ABC transport system permease protein